MSSEGDGRVCNGVEIGMNKGYRTAVRRNYKKKNVRNGQDRDNEEKVHANIENAKR